MNKELAIEYEVFEEEGEVVLSVVDKEKDEVLNMFKGKMAENIYRMLSGEERNKLSSADSKIDDAIKAEMEKCREEIMNKMTMIMEAESLTKEFIKKTFDEIRELVDNFEKLALERLQINVYLMRILWIACFIFVGRDKEES